jgi:hypothetical protein
MRQGFKSASFLAGLAVLGAMMSGGRAEAGPAKPTGISAAGGVTYNPDPQFTYYIGVYLDAGDTFASNTAIESNFSIIGISSADTITTLYINPGVGVHEFNAGDAMISAPGTLTTIYDGPNAITAPATTKTLLEYFQVTTPNSSSQTGQQAGTTVDYTYYINGVEQPPSSFVLQAGPLSIPEPSSLVLMMIGGTVLPYLAIRERRRRIRHTA